jgi:hypothetical protein
MPMGECRFVRIDIIELLLLSALPLLLRSSLFVKSPLAHHLLQLMVFADMIQFDIIVGMESVLNFIVLRL